MHTTSSEIPFLRAFRGGFTSALRWPQLDQLWEVLRDRADEGWYVYQVGEVPPSEPVSGEQFARFLGEIHTLLRRDHEEDYCGIVYADDMQNPRLVKIYDPHNLGVVCGSSDKPPLPGWVLSRLPPCDLPSAMVPTGSRRRWWKRLFG